MFEFISAYQTKRETKPVDAKNFYNFDDKIRYRQMMILKLVSDEQKDSFSYKSIRKILKKLNYIDNELPETVGVILNEFLDIRNWSFHNTQSSLMALDEVVKMSIPKELEKYIAIQPQFNPVVSVITDYYDIEYLFSLYLHTVKRLEQFNIIFEYIKKDYEYIYKKFNPIEYVMLDGNELIDNKKVVFKTHHEKKPKTIMDESDMIAQVSMSMQKKKYDGSKECFDALTLHMNKKE